MKKSIASLSSLFMIVTLWFAPIGRPEALAHELGGHSDGRYKLNPLRHGEIPSYPRPSAEVPGNLMPQFVVVLPFRWAAGQVLHICFYQGSPTLRNRIVKTASAWLQYANLKFDAGGPGGRDCVPHDKSEIRIGFDETGWWSAIGTDTFNPKWSDLPSMNLQGFADSPPVEPMFSGLVLHEFGHALGFHHEHQSPAENCDKEYDWQKLYSYYQRQYGWEKSKVDFNVRQLMSNRSAYDWSETDPNSIMIYASDPEFLLRGKKSPCYFHDNYILSDLDKRGAAKTYPFGDLKPILESQKEQLEFLIKHAPSAISQPLSAQLQLTVKQLQVLK